MKDIMEYQWMPQKIGSMPSFLWWEVDEIIVALLGILMFVVSGNILWALLGIGFSYCYTKFYKKNHLRVIWKDIFFSLGILDLTGYPKGIIKKFEE